MSANASRKDPTERIKSKDGCETPDQIGQDEKDTSPSSSAR